MEIGPLWNRMTSSGVASCLPPIWRPPQYGHFQNGPIFLTIPMSTTAICDIEHGLLYQGAANILVAPPTLGVEDAHAEEGGNSIRRGYGTAKERALPFSLTDVVSPTRSASPRF